MAFDLGIIFPDPGTQAALADTEVSSFPDGEVVTKILRGNAGYAWAGLQKLIQAVVIELFSTPLPDGSGAGLGSLFDGTVRDVNPENVRSLAAQAVETTRLNIMSYQAEPGPVLSLDETLAGLSMIDARDIDGIIRIDLSLETGAGDEVTFTSAFRFL